MSDTNAVFTKLKDPMVIGAIVVGVAAYLYFSSKSATTATTNGYTPPSNSGPSGLLGSGALGPPSTYTASIRSSETMNASQDTPTDVVSDYTNTDAPVAPTVMSDTPIQLDASDAIPDMTTSPPPDTSNANLPPPPSTSADYTDEAITASNNATTEINERGPTNDGTTAISEPRPAGSNGTTAINEMGPVNNGTDIGHIIGPPNDGTDIGHIIGPPNDGTQIQYEILPSGNERQIQNEIGPATNQAVIDYTQPDAPPIVFPNTGYVSDFVPPVVTTDDILRTYGYATG